MHVTPMSWAHRAFAVGTVVALGTYVLDGWVPRFVAEPVTSSHPARLGEPKIDAGAVVERLRHRVVPATDGTGALEARGDAYQARFDASGFSVAGLGVSLKGADRGATSVPLAPEGWRATTNVAERALRAGVTERVTARDGEVEWDVVLQRPPPGRGDLRIEAGLGGLQGAPRMVDRVWRLPVAGGAILHMGELIVKDARGRVLHRALPALDGDRVMLDVPARVLAGARYPLTVDPSVGPELPASDPVYGPGGFGQSEAAVAWDGSNYLVVWRDERAALEEYIYAARVTGAGVVLDNTGFRVSSTRSNAPAVAWNGSNFLVVWESNSDIRAARVSSGGAVLDPSGFDVATAAGGQIEPSVASDGSNFLVVWGDFRTSLTTGTASDVYGARITGAGTVLEPNGIPISAGYGHQTSPSVAFNGLRFLVAWDDARSGTFDVYASRVNKSGIVVDGTGIAVSTATGDQQDPAVASDGSTFLVAWSSGGSPNQDIYAARVSNTGVVADPTGIAVSTAAPQDLYPAATWDGTNFVIAWEASQVVRAARVTTLGAVLDAGGFPVGGPSGLAPAVTSNGSSSFLAWHTNAPATSGRDVYAARVSSGGGVVDSPPILVSITANNQRAPALAWNPEGRYFLVVWRDDRGTSADIYGARVTGTGTILDGTGFPISTAPGDQTDASVVWSGTHFLVVWDDVRSGDENDVDIYGARVDTNGTVLEPGGIPISARFGSSQDSNAVAWDGTNFLVVWRDTRSGSHIYGARVSDAGAVLEGAGIPISTAAGFQDEPALAWNGMHYLVVWKQSSGSTIDIEGVRVNRSGTLADSSAIVIETGTGFKADPAVAWSGNWLVVWVGGAGIQGARVSYTGTVLDPSGITISDAPDSQSAPVVAAQGNFLVLWHDRRSGTLFGDDIYATRVRQYDGMVLDPSGFAVAASGDVEDEPALTSAAYPGFGAAYFRTALEPVYGAHRVFLRVVSPK